MVRALRELLDEADAVIVCGGLGPTPDDVTREAIAEVMGVELERRDDLVEWVSALFASRGRDMPANNLRQCDIPVGAEPIPNSIGTAPGIRAPIGDKVVYAVPGVPYEMRLMMSEQVLPDLLRRAGEQAAIVSRTLKTWGTSESGLAEMIADRVDAQTNPTIAFLARGIEGLSVRLTAKAATRRGGAGAHRARGAGPARDPGRSRVRRRRRDDGVGRPRPAAQAGARRWGWPSRSPADWSRPGSSTSPGTSDVLTGGVVAYMTDVKRSVLGVDGRAGRERGVRARDGRRGAPAYSMPTSGIAVTGCRRPGGAGGPAAGHRVLRARGRATAPAEAVGTQLPGQREMVRQFATISLLNLLRLRLVAME